MNGLALCAGAAGIELGLKLALGDAYRTVGYVEREAFAASVLVARIEDQTLDPAPVWDDLTTFDGRAWRGRVDLVTAGFPCQPWSDAGAKRGTEDERWLWPDIARIVRDVGPTLVFLENVRGLLVHDGLGSVLGDLADLGFDAEWSVCSAAEIGATHKRERVWILAYRDISRLEGLGRCGLRSDSDAQHGHDADGSGGTDVAHPGSAAGRPEVTRGTSRDEGAHGRRPQGDHEPHGSSQAMGNATGLGSPSGGQPVGADEAPTDVEVASAGLADSASARRQGCAGPERRIPGLDEVRSLFPPGPDDVNAWRRVLDLDPSVEPSLHRMADGLACRVERSHLIGNGVLPLVAAVAFIGLARRAGLLEVVTDAA